MRVKIKEVNAIKRDTIPAEGETIDQDIHVDQIVKHCNGMNVYQRSKQECPFGRGNWIVDCVHDEEVILCLKLPLEMTKNQLDKFLKPLLDVYSYGVVCNEEGEFPLQ